MTPEQAKELLPIITAFAENKEIQYQTRHGWQVSTNLSFEYPVQEYRIKPDPVVIKYRRFLFKCSDNTFELGTTNKSTNSMDYLENRSDFVCWIDTDWVTYECEV